MLLRSSSTPVLGSLLSSFSDTPNNLDTNKHHYSTHHQIFSRSPYHQIGCLHLSTVSCNSSPISPSIADLSDCSLDGLRRAQSENNLEGLTYISCSNKNEECSNPSHPMKVSARKRCLMLETIPSFSLYNLRGQDEEEEDEDNDKSDVEYDEEEKKQVEANEAMGSGPSSSNDKMENKVLSEQVEMLMKGSLTVGFEEKGGLMISEEMYLAKGLGIGGGNSDGNGSGGGSGGNCGGGGGGKFHWGGEDGGDMGGTEEYYKKMLEENPGNSLFLRNYAEYLYQSKGDVQGAEEYYSRAILADPKDGEVLSQYAKLIWELHQDHERASSYFERAVEASPEDSHVHAAYARFLWETEEEDDECNVPGDFHAHFHQDLMASTGS